MKKRFESEAEIIEMIDRYLEQIVKANSSACDLEHLIVRLRETCEASRIPGLRSNITTLANEVAWREGRIETLKEVLAEFRTAPLPGIIPDNTVAAA
jgi:hypothetical protein